MSIYSLGVRTSNTAVANACFELIGGANLGYRLLEMGLTLNTATALACALGQPATIGGTPTTPVAVLAEDGGNSAAGNSTTALAWTTGPVAPTAFYRRVSLPATIGAGIIWTFPRGLPILKAKTLVLWDITAGVVSDVWVVVDE